MKIDECDECDVVRVTVGDDESDERLLTCLARPRSRGTKLVRRARRRACLHLAGAPAAFIERHSLDLMRCEAQPRTLSTARPARRLRALDLPHVGASGPWTPMGAGSGSDAAHRAGETRRGWVTRLSSHPPRSLSPGLTQRRLQATQSG